MKPRYANPLNLKARYLGTLQGRKVFEWPVELTFGERAALTQEYDYPKKRIWVKSHTAAEAADFAANEDHCDRQPCVEISVWGQKAGLAAKRFWGWDRAIMLQMADACLDRQLQFNFGGAR